MTKKEKRKQIFRRDMRLIKKHAGYLVCAMFVLHVGIMIFLVVQISLARIAWIPDPVCSLTAGIAGFYLASLLLDIIFEEQRECCEKQVNLDEGDKEERAVEENT